MFTFLNLFRDPRLELVIAQLSNLRKQVMTTHQELTEGLTAIATQISKIGDESSATLTKVTELEEALANAGSAVPAEVSAAFEALKTQVQRVDDLVPDAVQSVNDLPVDTGTDTGTVGEPLPPGEPGDGDPNTGVIEGEYRG